MDIRDRVGELLAEGDAAVPPADALLPLQEASYRADYVRWLLAYSGVDRLGLARRPRRIAADAGNGAGLVLTELAHRLSFALTCLHMEPDGTFPNGVPNPLLPERRAATAEAVRKAGADMGIAWDGDFDRCSFYDAEGNFIEGHYCIGLLGMKLSPGHH